jgi:hypothetical protein
MPALDEQTFRWLTVVNPLLQVLFTAVVTAVVAVWATRSEAARAERRAAAESERAERRAAAESERAESRSRAQEAREYQVAVLRHTHEDLLATLQRAANVALPPGQNALDLGSIVEDVTLVDDSQAVTELMHLTTDFTARPAGSGVSDPELRAIVDVTNRLRASLDRQAARVRRGEDPVRVVDDSVVRGLQEDLKKLRPLRP